MKRRNERLGRRALELPAIDARIFGTSAPVRGRTFRPRKSAIVLLTLAVVGLTALSASAGSPHFKKGGSPTCTFSTSSGGIATDTVTCQGGTLAGLGGDDLKFSLSGSGFATFSCTNQGGNEAAGQNKVAVSLTSTSQIVPGSATKNGNLTGPTLTTTVPTPTATGEQAGCPNPNWSATPKTIAITSVTLTIEQPVGTPIFTCTASNSAGLTGTVTLTCV